MKNKGMDVPEQIKAIAEIKGVKFAGMVKSNFKAYRGISSLRRGCLAMLAAVQSAFVQTNLDISENESYARAQAVLWRAGICSKSRL